MRLIDADALLNEFLKRYTGRERNRNLVFASCEIKQGCPMKLSFNWTEDDDFCSYGERKEGADNG